MLQKHAEKVFNCTISKFMHFLLKISFKVICIQPQNKSYIEYYHLIQSLIVFSDKRHAEIKLEESESSGKSQESSGSHSNSHTSDTSSSKSSDEDKKKKMKKPPKIEVKRSTKKVSGQQVKLSTKEITTTSIKPSSLKEEDRPVSKKQSGIKINTTKKKINKETLAEEAQKFSSTSSNEELELNETISVHTKEASEHGIDEDDDNEVDEEELSNETEND
jgi:hypothetical protein